MNKRVGIIGCGLAGLVIANELLKKGYRVEILEKDSTGGGLLKTEKINGFYFDIGGSHIIFSKKKSILDYMLSLLNGNYVKHYRNTKIFFKGKFIKYPFENGLMDLDPEDKFFALYEYFQAILKREKGESKKPSNFLEWLYYWFGKGLTELYLLPYNRKIWKYPLDKIGLDWISGRVPSPPLEDVVKSALGIPTEGYVHQLNFFYPERGGIFSLIQSLKNKFLRSNNARIIYDVKIQKITKEDSNWILKTSVDEKIYDLLISTAPLGEIILLINNVPKEIKDATRDLKWNSLITVGIAINKPRICDFHWVYFPGREPFHRIGFQGNYSPNMAPEGKTNLLVEITVPANQFNKVNLDAIAEDTIETLIEYKFITYDDIIFHRIWKWKYAYVISDRNWLKSTTMLLDYLQTIGLYTTGRWGHWKYLNMDHTIEEALNLSKIL
ncbi:MAG: NAD(P)/FAD-dependent oxidoreductase [Candidatus Njordarchaeum guaymaensis]